MWSASNGRGHINGPAAVTAAQSAAITAQAAEGKALVGDGGPPNEFVREAAEAEIDLLRIRKIRASKFDAMVSDPDAPPEAYAELAETLDKLERYERRAFSRRKRALHVLTR